MDITIGKYYSKRSLWDNLKIFITGISGLLGVNFAWQAAKCHSIAGSFFNNPVRDLRFESVALDITCKQSVQEVCKRISPDVVIHTAAMTNVELCEDNPVLAGGLNHVATRNVAESARDIKA